MKSIKDRMLKFNSMITKGIVTNHILFANISLSMINLFAFINSFVIHHL